MTEAEKLAEESLTNYRQQPKWAGKMFMHDENTCYKDGFLAGLKGGADRVLDNWCRGDDPCPYLKKRDDQLTKAKELLKDITSSYGSTEVSEAQLYLKIKKAEQFLKE